MSDITKILTNTVKAMVGRPSQVSVTETAMTRATVYTVKCSDRDYGRVVGAKAKSYRALELLMKLISSQDDEESRLTVVPPTDSQRFPREVFESDPSWGKDDIEPLLRPVVEQVFRGGTLTIREPDMFNITAEIKVNANDEYSILQDGQHSTTFIDESKEPQVISAELIQKALRTIFHAIGKSKGRNVQIDVIPIYFGR